MLKIGKEEVGFMTPLVSVVLIAYNEEKFITQALESIINQKTNFSFEVLCHDDASTDSTQEIILSYQKKYPEIIVPILQTENKMQAGHQVIVEYCYPVARGKYIAYCDGDDYWTDINKLQKQVDFLETNPEYTLCFHNFVFLHENTGKFVLSSCGDVDKEYSVGEFIEWNSYAVPQLGTSVFRKELAMNRPELFVKIGGGPNSKRPISDQPLYIYLSIKGKVKYFHEVMSVWRRHDNTWGQVKDFEREIQFLKDKIEFFKTLENDYPGLPGESLKYARGNCWYRIGWFSEDYHMAWKNLQYSNVHIKTKLFVLFALVFPKIAQVIRNAHK